MGDDKIGLHCSRLIVYTCQAQRRIAFAAICKFNLPMRLPYDLEETELSEYKSLDPRWHDWNAVKAACSHVATVIFDRVCDLEADRSDDSGKEP